MVVCLHRRREIVSRRRHLLTLGVAIVLLAGALSALRPANSIASYGCGSFKVPLLIPRVHVRVVRGSVACAPALAVMKWAYNSYESGYIRHHDGWRVLGPQTCVASATKGRKKITGLCGPA